MAVTLITSLLLVLLVFRLSPRLDQQAALARQSQQALDLGFVTDMQHRAMRSLHDARARTQAAVRDAGDSTSPNDRYRQGGDTDVDQADQVAAGAAAVTDVDPAHDSAAAPAAGRVNARDQGAPGPAAKTNSHSGGARPRLQVHCFTFNRPASFGRLWTSLMSAHPAEHVEVDIVIHSEFDPAGGEAWREQRAALRKLDMSASAHGHVRVQWATANQGLKATMLGAWTPSLNEYALYLEDDVEVSPLIFRVAEAMILQYGETSDPDPSVVGFKLYNQVNVGMRKILIPLTNCNIDIDFSKR